mmetsp:Transcript_52275/g.103157  ORF Transcript_52275/g.103157 Transcript_52275/m.103157 type:complete len:200 (-) Transcript_52275:302-901(-)
MLAPPVASNLGSTPSPARRNRRRRTPSCSRSRGRQPSYIQTRRHRKASAPKTGRRRSPKPAGSPETRSTHGRRHDTALPAGRRPGISASRSSSRSQPGPPAPPPRTAGTPAWCQVTSSRCPGSSCCCRFSGAWPRRRCVPSFVPAPPQAAPLATPPCLPSIGPVQTFPGRHTPPIEPSPRREPSRPPEPAARACASRHL